MATFGFGTRLQPWGMSLASPRRNLTNSLEKPMKLIDISTRKFPNTFTMVDDADFEWLNQWKWTATNRNRPHRKTLYAERKDVTVASKPGISIHRLIMNTPSGLFTDHIDGNGLNNQRANLRICTQSQNQMNTGPKAIGRNKTGVKTSKYKGVWWNKDSGKYESQIKTAAGTIWHGKFIVEDDAARAYNEAAKIHYGEFARLNEVPDAD